MSSLVELYMLRHRAKDTANISEEEYEVSGGGKPSGGFSQSSYSLISKSIHVSGSELRINAHAFRPPATAICLLCVRVCVRVCSFWKLQRPFRFHFLLDAKENPVPFHFPVAHTAAAVKIECEWMRMMQTRGVAYGSRFIRWMRQHNEIKQATTKHHSQKPLEIRKWHFLGMHTHTKMCVCVCV